MVSFWKSCRLSLESFLCRLGFWIFPRIPHAFLRVIARFAGWGAARLARQQRQVALANIEVAFGDRLSVGDKNRLVNRSFQNVARTALESLGAERLKREGFERHFEFTVGSLERLKNLVSRNKGLIALTFHYGNWEWLSLAWGMAGYPLTAVAQPIKNPRVDELFRRSRQQAGHRLLHRRHAARQLYKALKRREIIGLLVDLNSSVEEGGAFFEFFGLPVLTTRAVGHLAMRSGAPIVCSIATPRACGRYQIEIGPEIPYDPHAPLEREADAITRRWISHCEEVIRNRPEFWMWMYKRWKVRPMMEMGRYPFYSFHDPRLDPKLDRLLRRP